MRAAMAACKGGRHTDHVSRRHVAQVRAAAAAQHAAFGQSRAPISSAKNGLPAARVGDQFSQPAAATGSVPSSSATSAAVCVIAQRPQGNGLRAGHAVSAPLVLGAVA